jgi:hypothetical protein
MKYGRYGLPIMFLRWGLGLTFAGIGIDILWHPDLWIGYVPESLPFISLSREVLLQAGGVLDIAIGVLLMMNVRLKIASFLAVAHLISIIAFNGIDAVLIRNIGLLGAALAIMFWPSHYHKKKGRLWSRKSKGVSSTEE